MKPFFTYYGGKWRTAGKYLPPRYGSIVEPFAGSAGYSVRNNAERVELYDLDERVISTWTYLINSSESEILSLPLCDGSWITVDDLNIHQEARWLIGWWLNKGSSSPGKSPSRWMRDGIRPDSYWGPVIRSRIASQVNEIRHWSARVLTYQDIPNPRLSTWFVDPPYEGAGRHYRSGSGMIDYLGLASWCADLPGRVIVCENEGASWLPFGPFYTAKGSPGSGRSGVSNEVVWVKDVTPGHIERSIGL